MRPGCCLYLTDMECDSFPETAPLDILWPGASGDPHTAIDTASPGASASTSDQPDTAGRARIILHIRAPARKEAGCAEAG